MNLDEQIFLAVNEALSGPVPSTVFSSVTRLGNGWVLAALVIAFFAVFDRKKLRTHLVPMAVSVALGGLAITWAKVAVHRERPAGHFARQDVDVHTPLGTPSDMSFPSGHTQTAFGAAVFLSCMYPVAAPFLLVAAALVGISRMALGVHFPLDVLVGALTGAVFALAGYHLNRWRLAGSWRKRK
jgi:undecaprenyl-diphosphatase